MTCRTLSLKQSFFEVYTQGCHRIIFQIDNSFCPVFSSRCYCMPIAMILIGFAASAESLVTAGFKYPEKNLAFCSLFSVASLNYTAKGS